MRRSAAKIFVDGVYRRLVIFRTIEQFGLGMLAASVMATVLNLVAIWQGVSTFPILLFLVCFGLLIGAVLTIYRWPTRVSAVSEADRQLQLNDLLTSAMFASRDDGDDFSNIVRAMADAKCELYSPSDVFLRRLSASTWSAIGVATSVAVVLSVIPFGAVRSQAIDVNASLLLENSAVPTDNSNGKTSQQINDPTSGGAWSANASSEQMTNAAASKSNNPHSIGTGSSSGGGSVTAEDTVDQKFPDVQDVGNDGAGGDAAGGGAASANVAQHGDKYNRQSGMTNRAQNQIPFWAGDNKIGRSFKSNVPSNKLTPPEDRDLIRDFFDGH